MIKGEGGDSQLVLGLTSHRFWCRHNNDDYSVSSDSCVSINIACSKEEGKGRGVQNSDNMLEVQLDPIR